MAPHAVSAPAPSGNNGGVAAAEFPTTVGYTVLVLAHAGLAALSLVIVVTSSVEGYRLAMTGTRELSAHQRRYFATSSSLAPRLLYAVPITGAWLLVVSRGAATIRAPWIGIGICCWLAAIAVTEVVLLPTEAAIATALNEGGTPSLRSLGLRLHRWAAAAGAVVLFAGICMVWQPG